MSPAHGHDGPPPPPYQGPPMSRLAKRIHGWSWQAFPIGMGTGAVYLTLAGLKNHPSAVTHIEVFFYFLNIALFLLNTSTLLLQAILYTAQFKRLLFDPVKGVFVPLVALSFATIIIGTINYTRVHIPVDTIYALFWVYVTVAVFVCFPMLMIWFNQKHPIETFTPAYAFLIFPMMLVGVVAFNVLRVLDENDPRALGVLLVGYFFQGMGFFMTFFYLVLYLLRIMLTGFLDGHQANGAFVACGPPGFTGLALIRLGEKARLILPVHNLVSPTAGEVWYATSVLAALLLFGLAVFFFLFGVLPYWFKVHKHLREILGCWALTFPNVGWITLLRAFADIFNLPGLNTVHAILTTIMCVTWAVLIFFTGLAFWRGKIFLSDDASVAQDSGVPLAPTTPVVAAAAEAPPSPTTRKHASDWDIEKDDSLAYYSQNGPYDVERQALPPLPPLPYGQRPGRA